MKPKFKIGDKVKYTGIYWRGVLLTGVIVENKLRYGVLWEGQSDWGLCHENEMTLIENPLTIFQNLLK